MTFSEQAGAAVKNVRIIEPFDYHGVTLDDSRMEHQFDEVKDFYLSIPNDDLLHGFRKRAGQTDVPGKELGGWYTADGGNVFPQIVSGFARMFAASGDVACYEKAAVLIEEWAKCIAPDGYFFYSDHPTSRQYCYEKTVGALIDMYHYCGNENVLEYLGRITDWAEKNMDRTRDYAQACGDPRHKCHEWGEWYTVSESLYRAYLATGDERYKSFAEVWEYPAYWNLFLKKNPDIFTVGPDQGYETTTHISSLPKPEGGFNGPKDGYHAYSHVNTFASAAAAYLVKGDPHYLEILKHAYDYIQGCQTYATGGYGPGEAFMPYDRFKQSLEISPNHCEAQCGSWAGFKISKYLMSFTGDASYGDWIERMIYNLIGADIPMAADGKVFYYAYYHLKGGVKKLYPDAWPCCTGTRPQTVADYHDLIYFKDESDLYVNLFTPSTVEWEKGGAEITVWQQTRFPDSEEVEFVVSVEEPVRFGLKLRVPGWIAGPMIASVNGDPVELKTDDRHWATIEREWQDGDVLIVTVPMKLWVSRLSADSPFPAAILHGPVVLAMRSLDGSPSAKIDFENLDKSLIPSPGEPLTYHLAADPNVLVRPFYAFKEGEEYFIYFDPSKVKFE